MKIVFFGSGKFGVNILDALHRYGHEVALVVTQPDRKKGRHLRPGGTPVKDCASAHRLKVFQPQDVNAPETAEILKASGAELFVVVSYGRILSRDVLSIPEKLSMNIHASLLPKYRGAAPVQWALINGERRTGVTFIRMNEWMDRGDILMKKSVAIGDREKAPCLEDRLSELASGCINGLIEKIRSQKARFLKQDENRASYAPLMTKMDGLIRWGESSAIVYRRFRGCFGWPGSFSYFRGKILKILDMAPGQQRKTGRPGEIIGIKEGALEVACGRGSVLVKEVLPDSHHRMTVRSFLAGHKVSCGDLLG